MQEEKINSLPYLSISNQKIVEALKGKNDEQLKGLPISPVLLFMIRIGYATKLRADVFDQLSTALGLDISANASSTQQSEITQNLKLDSEKP